MEAQISSNSALLENETSNENFTVNGDSVITEKMLLEERLLEEKIVSEEQILREKIQEEKKKEEEEQCFKRLRLLLSRSSIYAQFMAEKLKKHEEERKATKNKKQEKSENSKLANKSTKRKAAFSSARKKVKANQNIADFFKNQTGNDELVEENYQNGNGDSLKLSLLERQPKLLTGGVMREYQIDGYEWLKTLYENGVNGILADEMGLGKTIQCIAFIAYLIEMSVSGPFFVCGPLSTVPNWYAEFRRFAPDVPVMIYHGDKMERNELRKKIKKKVRSNDVFCFPVVITSYQIALIDAPKLASIEWKMLVIDEAHRIKNFQCKLIGSLKKYNAVHRLLLTGTPLQNNLTELWSLLNFILPEIFDDLQIFHSWFDISRLAEKGGTEELVAQEQEKQIVSTIHQILTPFLLRRTKADVELNLPPKKTVVVRAPMTQLQQKYYNCILNFTLKRLDEKKIDESVIIPGDGRSKRKSAKAVFYGEDESDLEDDSDLEDLLEKEAENISLQVCNNEREEKENYLTTIQKIFEETFNEEATMSEINLKLTNIHMILRKVCCHPYLVSCPLDPKTLVHYLVDENIVKSSGKLLVLDILLHNLKKLGHKVLLFSQFVKMLELLEDYCAFRKFKFTRLYGWMSLEERQEQIKAFNEDDSTFIFLISTKAGGLGLNLTSADTVVLYDTDWNPQNDLQAQDRCHRIGQTKPVVVYHLVLQNTYDEKIYNHSITKRKLEKVIMQKGRFNSKDALNRQQRAITKEELLELLESSDANGFVNADNFVIPPKELESILDRSDMVVNSQ